MKLTKNWHSNKPKRIGPKPRKIPLQLLGISGPIEEQKSNSIEEVRRQAVLMSSGGFRKPLVTKTSKPNARDNARNQNAKPRRGATE